jgi:hypothetical protein
MTRRRCRFLVAIRLFGVAGTALGDAPRESDNQDPVGAALDLSSALALAHHGPGTSGGGSSTISGETLKQGTWDLDLRTDYTKFKRFDQAEAEAHAATAGEFDAVDWSLVTSLSVAYGIVDDFQISATLGYYHASNFISAELDPDTNTVSSGTDNPSGLTDLWINPKFRVMKGKPGNLAIIGGIKVPIGNDNQRLDNDELLEPSSQPGSGAWDFQTGLAYSRFLTSQLTLDASGVYTFRTTHDDFKVGDRADFGVAIAYRLTEDIQSFPQWSIFGETNFVWVRKDKPEEGPNPNTGGSTLFLTPGARVRFSPTVALTMAPSFPVYQDLNGDQDKTTFKLAATLSVSF